MPDSGAGSSTIISGAIYGYFDWGAGSPTPTGWDSLSTTDREAIRDLGAGSSPSYDEGSYIGPSVAPPGGPTRNLGAPTAGTGRSVIITGIADKDKYPDEGGVIVNLTADFPNLEFAYNIRIRSKSGEFFPNIGFAYARIYKRSVPELHYEGDDTAFSKNPYDAYVDPTGTLISFALPPAPPGVYDVVMSRAAGGGAPFTVVLEDAVAIVPRRRFPATYRVRSGFPPNPMDTKANRIKDEPKIS